MDLFKFFGKKPASGSVAKNRLQLVLIQDRTNCSPRILEALKADLLNVLSKYMEIDEGEMEIQIAASGGEREDAPTLYANIPIKNLRMPR
jgi:cell division topological specificity factor